MRREFERKRAERSGNIYPSPSPPLFRGQRHRSFISVISEKWLGINAATAFIRRAGLSILASPVGGRSISRNPSFLFLPLPPSFSYARLIFRVLLNALKENSNFRARRRRAAPVMVASYPRILINYISSLARACARVYRALPSLSTRASSVFRPAGIDFLSFVAARIEASSSLDRASESARA